jgi:hypothetical protein
LSDLASHGYGCPVSLLEPVVSKISFGPCLYSRFINNEAFIVVNIKIIVFNVLFYPEGGGDRFLRNVSTYTSTRRHIRKDGNLNKACDFVISQT